MSMIKNSLVKDLTGQRFGTLVVVNFQPNDKRGAYWLCQCDCGNITIARGSSLTQGRTTSCKCVRNDRFKGNRYNRTHNQSKTRLYSIWQGIKARCYYDKTECFERYGGRGITVCDEWRDSFEAFRDWALVNGYSDNLTIERKDNDGNYEPSNCAWATTKEQASNRRSNIIVEHEGAEYTLLQLSERLNMSYGMLSARYERGDRGEILVRPVQSERIKSRGENNNLNKITEQTAREVKSDLAKGMTQPQISAKHNVSRNIVYDIKRGKTWAWL